MKNTDQIIGISRSRYLKVGIILAFVALLVATLLTTQFTRLTTRAATATGFPYSTPITLSPDDSKLWVVNPDPDNNSVTVIDVTNDEGRVLREIPVGREPNSVALNMDGSRAYVANTLNGTVSVINTQTLAVVETINNVGVEPRALVFTPNFTKLYVANSSSNDIAVINPATNQITGKITNPAFSNLFAMTVTNDGDADDGDELLYVTNLLAEYRPGSTPRPADDTGKEGVVSVISVGSDAFNNRIGLAAVQTAFRSNGRSRNASGDAVAPDSNPTNFNVLTSAFPNQLTSIAGTRQNGTNLIYTFATGSSPTGPVRFNVNVQALVSQIRGTQDVGQTANLNDEIRLEPTDASPNGVPQHRFASMPWGLAFFNTDFRALGVTSAADYVMVIEFDQNGKAFVDLDTRSGAGQTFIRRILTGTRRDPNPNNGIFLDGKGPRGIVINSNDTRAYTFNYVSRDITIIDITQFDKVAIKTVGTTQSKGDPTLQLGKELFNTGMGPIDSTNRLTNGAVNPIEGRMSDFAWMGCVSCHVNGLTDGVAWAFPAGPRVSVPMNTSFAPKTGTQVQRALNWTAIFDEIQDFELNTRGVAGGVGLIENTGGGPATNVDAFFGPNAGRDRRRDAITEYVKTIRSPLAPEDDNDPDVQAGRKLFRKVGCVACHGGPLWSSSRVQSTPPSTNDLGGDPLQLTGQLKNVGTFDPTKPHEVKGTGGQINATAQGATGFNPPSLLGVFQREKFLLHDGSVTSFGQLFSNQAHVGTNKKVRKTGSQQKLIKFLRSIDDNSAPFN